MSYISNPGSAWTDQFASLAEAGNISLGQIGVDPVTHKKYRFIQIVDLDVVAAGYVIQPGTVAWTGSADKDGATVLAASPGALPLGVALAAVDFSATPYVWVQIEGYTDNILTDGGVSAGDPLVPHTTDGCVDTMAAGEEHLVFATAAADDSGTVGSAYIYNCI